MFRKTLCVFVSLVLLAGLAFIVVSAPAAKAAGPWWDRRGPGQGNAYTLSLDATNNILYRGTSNRGVWKYQAGQWSSMYYSALDGVLITGVAADYDRDILYVCVDQHVYRCSNASTSAPTWTSMGNDTFHYTSLIFDRYHDVLYAGCGSHGGAWRCSTPEASPAWVHIYTGADSVLSLSFAMYVGNYYLFLGTGETATWVGSVIRVDEPQTGLTPASSALLTANQEMKRSIFYDDTHNKLYVGFDHHYSNPTSGAVFRCETPTVGTGGTWQQVGGISYPLPSAVLDVRVKYDGVTPYLYAASDQVWRNSDPEHDATGASWSQIGGPAYPRSFCNGYNDELVAGAMFEDGVKMCANWTAGSPAWSDTGGGVSAAVCNASSADGQRGKIYVGSDAGLHRLNEAANTWSTLSSVTQEVYGIAPDAGANLLYLCRNGGLTRVSNPDAGDAAAAFTNPFSGQGDCVLYDDVHGKLYAGGTNGIYREEAPRTTLTPWSLVASGGVETRRIKVLAYDGTRDVLYAGGPNGFWRGTGASGLPSWHQWPVVAMGNGLGIDTGRDVLYVATDSGVLRCPGASGSDAVESIGFGGTNVSKLYYNAGNDVLYVSGTGGTAGTWRCDNPSGAATWTQMTGLPSQGAASYTYDTYSHSLFAGTNGAGLWQSAYPWISAVSPTSGQQGQTLDVTVTGSYTAFGAGATASFGAGVNVNSTTVINATQAKANITIASDAATGARDVNVKSDADTPTPLVGGFTVTQAPNPPNPPNPPEPPVNRTAWYLAEGSTKWGFNDYVTIENPNDTGINCDITYMPTGAANVTDTAYMAPMSQCTINPATKLGQADFSTKVECREGLPIAVDRTMSWIGQGARSQEGHCSVGVTAPGRTWYLPEGSTKWGFECWLLIQNPNDTPADCQVTYMLEGESAKTVTHQVPARARATFDMSADIGAKDASIRVVANVPVIPERAMYRNNRREGHDSIGTTKPARDYYLAEGSTGYSSSFLNYVLIQNPQDTPTDVQVFYQTGTGQVPGPSFQMPANSRKTVRVNDQLPPNTDVSTKVTGSQPIIAERAMYWKGGPDASEACHDSIGMDAPHATFYLPDGDTSNGHETWTLVQNPNGSEVTVRIRYLGPSGVLTDWTQSIPANSRKSFNMADKGISGRAGVLVSSTDASKKIMVERSMYWNARGAGTDTIGGYSD